MSIKMSSEKLKQYKKDVTDEGEVSIEELREHADIDIEWDCVSGGIDWLDIDIVREFKDRILWNHVCSWKEVDKEIIKEFLKDIEKSVDKRVFEGYVLEALKNYE